MLCNSELGLRAKISEHRTAEAVAITHGYRGSKVRNRSTKSTDEKAISLSKAARVTEQACDSKIETGSCTDLLRKCALKFSIVTVPGARHSKRDCAALARPLSVSSNSSVRF